MDLGLSNKRTLVFASSEGLGKAVAAELAAEGASVLISSRSEDKLARVAKEIGASGFIVSDLSQPQAATRLVEQAAERLGGLDILVTNVGGPPAGMFSEISDDQWEQSFHSLFLSVVQGVRAAIPYMSESKWGRVAMITSIAGKEPIKNLTISNALRAGIHGLMNTLSKELGPNGITLNAVLPTFTDTERLRELGRSNTELSAGIPVGRLGQPEELGKLITFLCSEHAGFISGQAIGFDGASMQGI